MGTLRTILVVQGRKSLAGLVGFFEVLIWAFAIRIVFERLDNTANLFGYAIGFGVGNILGIWLEQKIGLGYAQFTIISRAAASEIAERLRASRFGVTTTTGKGAMGDVQIVTGIVERRHQHLVRSLVDEIDPNSFVTVQATLPYRGFRHGARK